MIDGWTLSEAGFDAVAGGLRKTYARGRRALDSAVEAPTSENFHEYRKRTKYTWYHVRLLDETAPALANRSGRDCTSCPTRSATNTIWRCCPSSFVATPGLGGDTRSPRHCSWSTGSERTSSVVRWEPGLACTPRSPDAFVARFASVLGGVATFRSPGENRRDLRGRRRSPRLTARDAGMNHT